MDWREPLPSGECSFVLGNTPFEGAKYQTAEQHARVRGVAALGSSGGTLDYVCAWFVKAGEYVKGSGARIGFVATNSITQSEQVAQLWPILFGRCGLEIAFAHRTFAWGSDARGKAHVHVVIIGMDGRKAAGADRRLFSYPDINGDPEESGHAALSTYLFDAGGLSDPHLVVREESAPINGIGRLTIGSKPIDGGNYIFDATERAAFLEAEPNAAPWLRPFIGAREYLRGGGRWILALHDAPPEVLAKLPLVRERIAAVRACREASKSAPTRKFAETPTLYNVNMLPDAPYLMVPRVSSERREYAPIGWLEPPAIPSDATLMENFIKTMRYCMANGTDVRFPSIATHDRSGTLPRSGQPVGSDTALHHHHHTEGLPLSLRKSSETIGICPAAPPPHKRGQAPFDPGGPPPAAVDGISLPRSPAEMRKKPCEDAPRGPCHPTSNSASDPRLLGHRRSA